MKKVRNNELPVSNHHFRFNLTTSVFINAINISIETLKERVFGWGLNRYESAFDFYMHNQIVIPYLRWLRFGELDISASRYLLAFFDISPTSLDD